MPYTEKRHPGKFEGCYSQWLGEVLYNATLEGWQSDETGDVQETGLWVGLVKGKRKTYLVSEDSQGFVDYAIFDTLVEAEVEFNRLAEEMYPEREE